MGLATSEYYIASLLNLVPARGVPGMRSGRAPWRKAPPPPTGGRVYARSSWKRAAPGRWLAGLMWRDSRVWPLMLDARVPE